MNPSVRNHARRPLGPKLLGPTSVIALVSASLLQATNAFGQTQPGGSPAPAPTYTPAPVQVVSPPPPQGGPPAPSPYAPPNAPPQYAPAPAPSSYPPPGAQPQYPPGQPPPYPPPGAQPQYPPGPRQEYPPGSQPPPQYPPPGGQAPLYPANESRAADQKSPAQDGRKDVMFKGALRIGTVIPMGDLVDSPTGALSDNVSNQTLVTFDVGLRYRAWFFGIYLGIGGGSLKGAGADNIHSLGFTSPTSLLFQIGPEVHYNFYDEGPLRPWVGLGLGLDALIIGASNGDTRYSESYTTFAPFHPMLGVDWLISKGFGLGVYVDWQIAKYSSVHRSITPPDDPTTPENESITQAVDTDIDILNTAYHEWLGLGVRAILFP